jgi:hypothetical protein
MWSNTYTMYRKQGLCGRCGGIPLPDLCYCAECKEKIRGYRRGKRPMTNERRAYLRAYNESHKERRRASQIAKRYNVPLEQAKKLAERVLGKCDICGKRPFSNGKRTLNLHVDHCHSTNKVRGVLCPSCNSGIAFLKDSPKIIENALKYIEKFK